MHICRPNFKTEVATICGMAAGRSPVARPAPSPHEPPPCAEIFARLRIRLALDIKKAEVNLRQRLGDRMDYCSSGFKMGGSMNSPFEQR
jgi:hypothetical protein